MNIGKWTCTTQFSLVIGSVLCIAAFSAQADPVNAKLLQLSSGDMALIMEFDGLVLSGRGKPNQDYLYIDLVDQTQAGTTREGSAGTGQPSESLWGYAEIILSCENHQLALYQLENTVGQEVLVGSFNNTTGSC